MPGLKRFLKAVLILSAAVGMLAVLAAAAEEEAWESRSTCELACELLRNRIESAGFPPRLTVGGELIYASMALPAFYERRAYRLAWSGNGGPLPQVKDLVAAVRGAEVEGLRSGDYHLRRIELALAALPRRQRAARPIDPHLLVGLDLLLTDAFLMYGSHLLDGRLDPESIDPEWHTRTSEEDLPGVLEDALARNRVTDALRSLLPRTPCYHRLREALARYRRLAADGGWPVVPEGGKLEKGSEGGRVGLLRQRLEPTGDLAPSPFHDWVFDEVLEDGVRSFQRRHGLVADGIVGPKTLAALNEPAEERVRQIEVNMERWRWLPRSLGERFIRVNIASFDLDLYEAGESLMNMRVMVGRNYRRTPVFSDLMTYLVINPYWHIPRNIAVEDNLPLIKQDPEYLSREKIDVLAGWGADEVVVDPATIDWSEVTRENFAWRLRQVPGPGNALGRIKFMFPNKFNVYLHDTPSQSLFEQNVRAVSSGCIRLEKPIELAEYLLRGYPEWTRPAILAAVDRGVEQTVRLLEPLPVHILYCTVWVGDDGEIQFRNDIYGRDRLVAEALLELPPGPEDVMVLDEPSPDGGEQ